MSLLISKVFTYDVDAGNYIQAVEAADAQALEPATRQAINNFVIGCKQDGIWTAIKASCILAGARTLAGALVPLVGTAPTNVNFISGDYNRKTGLGDASNTTKYLSTNRAGNVDPQNSFHLSCYLTTQPNNTATVNYAYLAGSINLTGSNIIGRSGSSARQIFTQNRGGSFAISDGTAQAGFVGCSRGSSTAFNYRLAGVNGIVSSISQSSSSSTIEAFRWVNGGTPGAYAANRIAFYSIGEALDLTLLDARVTALINAFAAAIP